MKKILTFNLIIIFVLTVAFPFQRVLAVGFFTSSTTENYKAISTSEVTVVNAVQTNKATLSVSGQNPDSVLALSCQVPAVQNFGLENGLVQNEPAINLNQPANCFSLTSVQPTSLKIELAVEPLVAAHPLVAVVKTVPYISGPNLAQAPLAQSLPILPFSFFTFGIVYALWSKKSLKKGLSLLKNQISLAVNFQQMQVLRC